MFVVVCSTFPASQTLVLTAEHPLATFPPTHTRIIILGLHGH